jgi:hypothetical protein
MRLLITCVAGAAALQPQPLGRPHGRPHEAPRVLADAQVASPCGDELDAETWSVAAQFTGSWKTVGIDDMDMLEKLGTEKCVPLYFRKVLHHTLASGGVFDHHLDAEGRYSESEESDCFFFDQSTAPALVNGPPVLDRAPGGEPVRRTVSCRDGRLRILEEPRVAAPRARAAGVMEHVLSLEGDTLRRRLTNKDTGTSVVWTMVRVERAASLRKTTLTTSHDDAAVLARFPAAQRPLLTATGNLQKILASFHNDEVWVRVDANDEVAPRIYERRVTIGIGARVCVHASSSRTASSPRSSSPRAASASARPTTSSASSRASTSSTPRPTIRRSAAPTRSARPTSPATSASSSPSASASPTSSTTRRARPPSSPPPRARPPRPSATAPASTARASAPPVASAAPIHNRP